MDLRWMEEVPRLRKLKAKLKLRHRLGNVTGWLPKTGLVPKAGGRKHGISLYMSVKNEALWIELTLRSIATFVDQFSIVDNGSTDETVEIIKRVADELSLDYILELKPDADFGEARDLALNNTTCSWVLRWDGDIICRTQGSETFQKIRDFALSLDQERYYAIYFPHVQLDGDLYHQYPKCQIHHEDYLVSYSPKLYHTRSGRMRELRYPFYYKRIFLWTPTTFHMWGFDSPEVMLERKYLEKWRLIGDFDTYPTLKSFMKAGILDDYGTDSIEKASALYLRERFKNHVKYDEERYGEYPELLEPLRDNFPLKMVYRDGKIAGRNDIMNILDEIDGKSGIKSVDVIIPTRNREELTFGIVENLLEQDYPDFRVIVCDQSDDPSEKLQKLSVLHSNFIYHAAQTRGLPAGRNEGLTLSGAEIVIFVDDDVIPEPGFIKGHVSVYENENVDAAAGKVIESRPEMNQPLPPGKVGKVDYWTGKLNRGFTIEKPLEIDSAQGVNMSFRRSSLEKTGGFDLRFGGSFLYEETDVFLTLKKMGCRIRYIPYAALTHLGAASGGCRLEDVIKEVYWYAHNFTLLFMKHFPRYTFPVWFSIRLAKFLRDVYRVKSIKPLIAGLKGMLDGYRSYRLPRKSDKAST